MPESARPCLTIWGCRGSLPVGGAGTARYGGATACVVLEEGTRRLVLDAGSGLRAYGRSLSADQRSGHHTLLLSHAHWDHLCGLPFFAPLYHPDATVTILGPDQPDQPLAEVIPALFGSAVWPLTPVAALSVEAVELGRFRAGGFTARAIRLAHAGVTLGYRINTDTGPSVSYITDNELTMMHSENRRELVQLVAGSDVLIHDATWADAILSDRAGWGHSSVGEAIELGMEAGCRTVLLFHHDPDADDDALDHNLAAGRARVATGPVVINARDGLTWEL